LRETGVYLAVSFLRGTFAASAQINDGSKMAQVKTSQLVDDISGKISNTVFTKSRQGLNIRKRVRGTNVRSSSQTTQRASLTSRSRGWVALTDAQRTAWNSAAGDFNKTSVLGNKYKMTGRSLYMMINSNLVFAGSSSVTSPPTFTSPTNLTSASVTTLSATVLSIAFGASPVATYNALIVEATRPVSPGLASLKSGFRYIGAVAAAATTPTNQFSNYNTKFGAPVVGKKVFFRITPVHTVSGLKGTPIIFNAIVA
jgi:hypothetical protein